MLVVPRVNGRLQSVNIKLGDPVRHGQVIAKVEDLEIQEQVRQAEASYQVSQASIRQREADLKLAKTNLDRSKSLLRASASPSADVRRHRGAVSGGPRAGRSRAGAVRAGQGATRGAEDDLVEYADRVTSRRLRRKALSRPGALRARTRRSRRVVDIRTVRMVANLVEKDVKRVAAGTPADVEVDAYPGEKFTGRVSRVAPVFDPATRTAEMEIEVPNPGFRLKPGMYARVQLTVAPAPERADGAKQCARDLDGKNGVFIASQRRRQGRRPARYRWRTSNGGERSGTRTRTVTVSFLPVETGIRDGQHDRDREGLAGWHARHHDRRRRAEGRRPRRGRQSSEMAAAATTPRAQNGGRKREGHSR